MLILKTHQKQKLLLVNEILRENVFTVYPGNMFNRNKRTRIGDEQSVISPVTLII